MRYIIQTQVEMETGTTGTGPLYTIKGIWNPTVQSCGTLNDLSNGKGEQMILLFRVLKQIRCKNWVIVY